MEKEIVIPKVQTKVNKSLEVPVVGTDGKTVGKITLPTAFGATINKQLLAQAVRVYLANQRVGLASTKTRGQVEGSTRKIYKQKGTGRARHGGIRAPIFVGGGIVFGPKPRDYHLAIPQKMKKVALSSALTLQYQQGRVVVLEGLENLEAKTKNIVHALSAIGATKSVLLVVASGMDTVVRCARNIEGVDIIPVGNLHPYAAVSHGTLVFMKQTLKEVESHFA